MDGENNGKPYLQMDDLGGKPTIFWKPPYGLAPFLDLCLAKSPQDLDLCRIFKNTFFPKLVTIPSTFLWGGGEAGEEHKSFGCSPRMQCGPEKIHGNPSKMHSTYQKWLQDVCPKISCQTFMYNTFSSWGQRTPSDASEYEVLLVLAVSILKHKHR